MDQTPPESQPERFSAEDSQHEVSARLTSESKGLKADAGKGTLINSAEIRKRTGPGITSNGGAR
jgi:hypothetical protein